MDRIKIWEKDDFFLIGGERKDMDPEVVSIYSDPLPLVWQYNFEKAYASVRDIRIEDGEITGEIFDWNAEVALGHIETLLEAGDIRFGGYYNEVKERKDGGHTQVTSCSLKAVSIVLAASMPGFPSSKR